MRGSLIWADLAHFKSTPWTSQTSFVYADVIWLKWSVRCYLITFTTIDTGKNDIQGSTHKQWLAVTPWRHQAWIATAATVRGSINDEWNNSGHVKSRLWEFHQSDKQSGCVHYYMEGGKGLFQAGHKLVWDCLEYCGWKKERKKERKPGHCCGFEAGWLSYTIMVDNLPWGWKPSYWRSSMPQKTGLLWAPV